MYTKNSNRVTFYVDSRNENTEKVIFGRVSEAIRMNKKDAEGKELYEHETWPARFVGKAYEKAKKLTDKTRITLTEWAARNPYNKEKKLSYPYLMVLDFDVYEQTESAPAEGPEMDPIDESDLPFGS